MHFKISGAVVNDIKKRIREIDSHKEFYDFFSDHCEHVLVHLVDPKHEPDCKAIGFSLVVLSSYAKARRESLLVSDWFITQGQLLEAIRLVEDASNETQATGHASGKMHLLALLNRIARRRSASRSSDE